MNHAVAHHYRRARAHQKASWNGGGSVTSDPSGRTELSYGGAAYGRHALAAYNSAKQHLHFAQTLQSDVTAHKRRSKAAKKGWKTRRAA